MNKADIKVGDRLFHRNRGECTFTMRCRVIEVFRGSYEGLYVELDGDIIEVSLALLSAEPK